MVAIKGVAHFSIPVSDVARSARFYTEVVGCRHLSTTPNGQMVFLDAAGTCLILIKRDAPINPVHDNHGGVHHAFAVAHDESRFEKDIGNETLLRKPFRPDTLAEAVHSALQRAAQGAVDNVVRVRTALK